MKFSSLMSKVRHFDNIVSKWLMRHFYFLFFQIILVAVFIFWFANVFKIIDFERIPKTSLTEHLLVTQTSSLNIIVLLMIINSFWMLYMFNCIMRIMYTQKDMSYTLSRMRHQNKPKNTPGRNP